MPIATTLGALLEQEAALTRIARSIRLRGQLLYQVVTLQRLVATETAVYYRERERLIQELGIDRDATRQEREQLGVTVVREVGLHAMPAFRQALEELAAVTVELACEPLAFQALAEHDIVPDDVRALGSLLDDRFQPPGGSS